MSRGPPKEANMPRGARAPSPLLAALWSSTKRWANARSLRLPGAGRAISVRDSGHGKRWKHGELAPRTWVAKVQGVNSCRNNNGGENACPGLGRANPVLLSQLTPLHSAPTRRPSAAAAPRAMEGRFRLATTNYHANGPDSRRKLAPCAMKLHRLSSEVAPRKALWLSTCQFR